MSTSVDNLTKACTSLNLKFEIDVNIILLDSSERFALFRIFELGAENGMLLFSDIVSLGDGRAIVDSNYGYSVLNELRPGEEFELSEYIELFSDWGWTGNDAKRPRWINA